jgi:hypothetical protein
VPLTVPVEYASQRKKRTRNKLYYRFNHWPLWIFVFLIAPGPLTSDLFEHGVDWRIAAWFTVVAIGTAIAGLRGRLPGAEPAPSIIYFTEDLPNPFYRRVCYTLAWSELIAFAAVNAAGLAVAVVTGHWYLKDMYRYGYFPIAGVVWILGVLGRLPRAGKSTRGEGYERRYFYATVWAVAVAHPVLWAMWRLMPQTRATAILKLVVFVGLLIGVGTIAFLGRLPRTRPIVDDSGIRTDSVIIAPEP